MSRIEELLREALADAPTPQPSVLDPRTQVARRVRAARLRRYTAISVAAVAAVLAATLTPALLINGHSTPPPPGHRPSPAPGQGSLHTWRVPGVYVEGATWAAGSVWLSGSSVSSNAETWSLVRMTPAGREVSRSTVPGPVIRAAYGLGRIWLYGGGDGAHPESVIDVLDPTTGHLVATTTVPPGRGGPQHVAFAHGSAWFALGDVPQLMRVTLVGGQLRTSTLAIATTNASIAATGDGQLWLGRENGKVTEVLPAGTGARLGPSYGWSRPLFSAAGAGAVWTTDGATASSRVIQLDPSALAAGDSVAQLDRVLPGFAATMAVQNSAGLWIGADSALAFYSPAALQSGAAQPTARIRISGDGDAALVQLVPLGASSVFVDTNGTVRTWTPGTNPVPARS